MKNPPFATLVFPIPVDREFTYRIPPEMDQLQPGMRVKALFKNRSTIGFVVGFLEKCELSKINTILEVLDPEPLVGEKILRLTRWIAQYYHSSWGEALDMALPSGVKEYVTGRRERLVSLNPEKCQDLEALLAQMEKKSPKGAKVLRALGQAEEPLRIQSLASALKITAGPIETLIKKGLLTVTEKFISLDPYEGLAIEPAHEFPFTSQQISAYEALRPVLGKEKFQVFLLHGVTGSGKTEIYLKSIGEVLSQGKSALVLIPEISLTPQNMKRFKSRFGENVAVLHSNLTHSQRFHQWHLIREGKAKVVIGPRSAVFAPLENLGLIVVDEEHEPSFKEHSSPRYHGRDVAIVRAQMEGAQVLLGSATPSLGTHYNVVKGKCTLLTLSERATPHALPLVEVVDMKREFEEQKGMVFFSRRLKFWMEETLKDQKQIILFLNRRGFSTYIFCQRCGFVLKCKHCDITLTFHKKSARAMCHYCGYDAPPPKGCPDCLFPALRYFGMGTEKIEEYICQLFPSARISRLDSDTMLQKGGYIQILESFNKRETDILVGTQIIAKGLDFPGVTLVGVISADVGLHMPDFYGAERTFQLLTQVAGRAGRGNDPGRVVVQTMVPDHYSILHASTQNYENFAEKELSVRKMFHYPPFCRLVRILIQGPNIDEVSKYAQEVKKSFPKEMEGHWLGPVPCAIVQIKGEYRFQLLGKFSTAQQIQKTLQFLPPQPPRSKVKFSVDVDPVGML